MKSKKGPVPTDLNKPFSVSLFAKDAKTIAIYAKKNKVSKGHIIRELVRSGLNRGATNQGFQG